MFCPRCGKQLADGYKFCTGCGNQITQSDSNQQSPKMQPPKMQQTDRQPAEAQNIPDVPDPNMSFHIQKTQETKQMEDKNRRMMIILSVVLVVLILVAVGMAVYYFSVLRNDGHSGNVETEEVMEDSDLHDEQNNSGDDNEAGSESGDSEEQTESSAVEQEEEAKVTSDTNEVVKDTILYNIPKSIYSYDFDESLGNAQVVVRDEIETEPETDDDIEPQYVAGLDGKAVYLDGTYGIRLSDVQRVGTSYSVAFWMKADALYDWAPFIHIGYNVLDPSQRSRFWLGQKTDGNPIAPIISSEQARTQNSFEIRPTSVLSSMETGVWYHIVVTVDGSKQGSTPNSLLGTLYVAGKYAGEGNIAVDIMNQDDLDVYLGINPWDELYPVAFDSVKIWDQVLDAGQVEELFNAYQ